MNSLNRAAHEPVPAPHLFRCVLVCLKCLHVFLTFFFFNDTATTEIYTLSLHDALPISTPASSPSHVFRRDVTDVHAQHQQRSEEHTSELQSQSNLVCRLLLEKKKDAECRVPDDPVDLLPPGRPHGAADRALPPVPYAPV